MKRTFLALLLPLAGMALHAQPYPEVQRTSFYVAVRDGTRLAMDLYRPAVDGQPVADRLPVIWQHSFARRLPPDLLRQADLRRMPELARDGYVVAIVDRRGLGASFGARRGYNDRTEARDAFDVTEWLARQPWSNGKVGVYGCSNTGDAAMHAATLMPPSLKAVFAGCFSFAKYDAFLRGGIPAQWGTGVERSVEEDLKNPPVDGADGPELLRRAVDDHRGNGPLAAMWAGMPYRDSWSEFTASRFWLEGSVATYREAFVRAGVGLYVFGGFDDEFRREGLIAYANLAPLPRRLTLGPWAHCLNDGYDLLGDARRFFDRFLKGADNGWEREPPVRFHVRGAPAAEAWRSGDRFPPAEARSRLLPLAPRGTGSDHALGGSGGVEAMATLAVQPALPCGNDRSPFARPCAQPGRALHFTAEPLAAPVEVIGHPLLRVWVSANQADADVFAQLESVAPDGAVQVLSDGRLRASLRKTVVPPFDNLGLPWHRSLEEDAQALRPGEPVELQLALLPVAVRVAAGHRLRLSLSGSDPRTRRPPPADLVLTVHGGPRFGSALSLPLMPTLPNPPAQTGSRRQP